MEARGALCLSLCTLLSLLSISGAAEVKVENRTFAVNDPAQLDIPSCRTSPTDEVEWKVDLRRLVKGNLPRVSPEKLNTHCDCKMLPSGALYLQRVENNTKYTVTVHNDKGDLQCEGEVHVTTQEPVDTPFMNVTCRDKKWADVRCFISRGSEAELEMSPEGSAIRRHQVKSLMISVRINQSKNVSCTAKNKVSETSNAIQVDCSVDHMDWYIYLAAGAGGVAFIIFIVLIIYSVRSCRRPNEGRIEDNTYNNGRRPNLQDRVLPQPPVQGNYINTNDTEDFSPQKLPEQRQGVPEATARGKKGKRQRPRPPEIPLMQPESLPIIPQPGPAPQATRPALPGNHPNDQTPKPTPRTKSKPPRQNHKSR